MSRSHGVFDFIQSQSSLFVNKLYGNVNDKSETAQAAWVCRGVLQSLCPLAKCYVMRLVFIETPISSIDIWRWCEPGHKSEHDSALKELIQLRVFVEVDKPDEVDAQEDEQWFVLNQYFRESIKYGMLSLSSPWQEDVTTVTTVKSMVKTEKENEENLPMETDEGVHNCEKADGPAVEELEMVSYSRWNTILEFLVTADESLKISSSVVSYLLAAGLMQTRGDMPPLKRSKGLHSNKINRNLSITSKGYEYMLLDIQSQVWLYVLQCLKNSENNQIELLRLVFVLSFCNVGTGYPVGLLSHSQKSLISDLHEIGIVHIPPAKSTESELYYPTHIAINVLSVAPPSANNDSLPDNAINSMSLTIIVETNFQVVAYINTSLHMAMLSLFVDTRTMMHLPNMLLGNITRDSAKAAFRLGISAQQIISFLSAHAHPVAAKNNPIIPENVADQLKLWQAEKKRFSCQDAVVIDLHDVADGLYLVSLYDKLVQYAQDMQVLVWSNPTLRELAVSPLGFPRLQAYAKSLDAPR